MALPASDNFNRGDGNLVLPSGGDWTKTADLLSPVISTNAVVMAASDSSAFWSTDAFNADHWSECKIITSADGGPAVRASATGCYYLGGSSGANAVWRYKSPGAWLQIGSALNFTYTSTDVIRIEATGGATTSIKVYKNGTQQGSTVTDSSSPLTTGSAGLYVASTTALDDWQGGDVGANTYTETGDSEAPHAASGADVYMPAAGITYTETGSVESGHQIDCKCINVLRPTSSYFGGTSVPAVTDGSNSTSPTVVAPPANMIAGDMVLVTCHNRLTADTQAVSETGGQTWTALTTKSDSSGLLTTVTWFWCRFNGTWTADPSFSHGGTNNSCFMLVFRPRIASNTWALDVAEVTSQFAAPTTPFDVTITGITTVRDNATVVASFSSRDDNTWVLQTAGWTTAFAIDNLAGSDSGDLVVFLFKATHGATGNVVGRETAVAGDAGVGYIASWREIGTDTAAIGSSHQISGADSMAAPGPKTYTETGAEQIPHVSSGADKARLLDTGLTVSPRRLSGVDNKVQPDSGLVAQSKQVSGADVKASIRTDTATVQSSKQISGADAVRLLDTGLSATTRQVSGLDSRLQPDTAQAQKNQQTSGVDAVINVTTGTVQSAHQASGADIYTARGAFIDAGSVLSSKQTSGADVVINVITGAVQSAHQASGADNYVQRGAIADTGAVQSAHQISGLDKLVSRDTTSAAQSKQTIGADAQINGTTGQAIHSSQIGGVDRVVIVDTGSATSTRAEGGADVYTPAGGVYTDAGSIAHSFFAGGRDRVISAETGSTISPRQVSGVMGGRSTYTDAGSVARSFFGGGVDVYIGTLGTRAGGSDLYPPPFFDALRREKELQDAERQQEEDELIMIASLLL